MASGMRIRCSSSPSCGETPPISRSKLHYFKRTVAMPDRQEEKKYDTPTAKVFYRLRDLFIQKSSVYTAKSLKLLPAGLGLLVALVMIGLVLYRLSEPVGKERGPVRAILPPAAETIK